MAKDPQNLPRISIVIVNYNLAEYLDTAIRSVVDQEYPNLELIVVDGGSTDGSVEVIRKYEKQIAWWVSEPDKGQRDALEKGFAKSTGEIMAWLNSDDRYHHRALWEVAKIFGEFEEVEWLMGYPTEFEPGGATINRIALPWARWSKWRYLTYDFQYIMQESTFWRRELWEKAGGYLDEDQNYAVDMELWARFFRHAKLYTTMTLLGGFRHRGKEQIGKEQIGKEQIGKEQISMEYRSEYLAEAAAVVKRERKSLSPLLRGWLSFQRFFIIPFGLAFFLDIPVLRRIYEAWYKLPPVIRYDFDLDRYIMNKRQYRHPNFYWRGKDIRRKPPTA